jgi:hypothetical protein
VFTHCAFALAAAAEKRCRVAALLYSREYKSQTRSHDEATKNSDEWMRRLL